MTRAWKNEKLIFLQEEGFQSNLINKAESFSAPSTWTGSRFHTTGADGYTSAPVADV